jgi:hypothetical protein
MSRHTIQVWDVLFVKVGEDGEPLTDNKGHTQFFTRKHSHGIQYLADDLEDKDLMEVEL